MKLKPFSGKQRCSNGETYTFKKGFAVVPGMRTSQGPVIISIQEFLELQKEGEK